MKTEEKKYIYESPDKGKTVYRRVFGKPERELIKQNTKELKNEDGR